MSTAIVPADGPVRLGSVQLPDGKQLFEWSDRAPRLWATSEPVPDAGAVWRALSDMRQDTGLVPILLAFLDEGHAGRPWDEGEFEARSDPSRADQVNAGAVLAESWEQFTVPAAEDLDPEDAAAFAPYGLRFPGMAPGQHQELTDTELAQALAWFGPARIGLVPAVRPADVLTIVGLNDVNRYSEPEKLTAVLRSWEHRFGAVLVEVGFASIRLLARRPPRTLPAAQAVAAELLAMCDEFWPIDKPGTAVCSVSEIADHIAAIPIWSLWLD
jgi:Domain of unknown function (DUF4253)